MFKLNLKQFLVLLLITFVIATLLSTVATWMDWQVNPNGLFHGESGIHWSVVWETLSSWLWPLWLMFIALGYVFYMIYRLIKN